MCGVYQAVAAESASRWLTAEEFVKLAQCVLRPLETASAAVQDTLLHVGAGSHEQRDIHRTSPFASSPADHQYASEHGNARYFVLPDEKSKSRHESWH